MHVYNYVHYYIRKRADDETTPTLTIGNGNVFEFDCTIETRNIGNENTFEAKCIYSIIYTLAHSLILSLGHVGESVAVTDKCVVGACCKLMTSETIPPSTIITGSNYDTWTRQTAVQVCSHWYD